MHLVVVVPPNTGTRYLGRNTRIFQVAGCQYKFLCTAVHSLLTDISLEHPTGASENTYLLKVLEGTDYSPPTKWWEDHVFIHVCHSVHRGSPCDHYPWCIGPQHKGTLALALALATLWRWDLIVQDSSIQTPQLPWPGTSMYREPHVNDIWCPVLEICSNLFTWASLPTGTGIWWLYASYWNAFLFRFKNSISWEKHLKIYSEVSSSRTSSDR